MIGKTDEQVDAIRRFNRFYTRRIGVLREGLLDSPFTLAEARVLYEVGTRPSPSANEIGADLGLDPGYLSRLLRALATRGLVSRTRSSADRRRIELGLTAPGRRAFASLQRRTREATRTMLAALSAPQRDQVVASMRALESALQPERPADRERGPEVVIRNHRVGDVGWAVARHGELYATEYGWNAEFEGLVATLFGRFVTHQDPARERCWIAEVGTVRAGCVFVVRSEADPSIAQLRCLLVEPAARGLGIGRRLVDECLAFARGAGYPRIMLWTNSILTAARRIYENAGFELDGEEAHRSFGQDLVGQVWSRAL